jgi:hypothetical protein
LKQKDERCFGIKDKLLGARKRSENEKGGEERTGTILPTGQAKAI